MTDSFEVAKFTEQDKLEDFLLRTKEGNYICITNYGIRVDDDFCFFSDDDEQDRLDEGLIKIYDTDNYVHIDNIEKVEKGCFVATVVYGSINAPQVQSLRNFRDNILIENTLGRALIQCYYGGSGRRIAHFIEENLPFTIPLIRKGLDVLVRKYSK